jgi:predicted nucleotidyltransferase component of viral defense system
MPRLPIQEVEVFHLLFLRALETRLDRKSYVVKGGVNLRSWFGSARYSEDLDLDAVSGEPYALRDGVDLVLASAAFQTLLRSQSLLVSRTSKPKQTETTQRWKFEIVGEGSRLPLHTKIEFSRRGSDEPYRLEPARSEIVQVYGLPPPTANHYTAAAAVRQKIGALVGRKEPQARDIWDLDHLFRTRTDADPRPLPARIKRALTTALDRVFETPFADFKSQVVPFLTPEYQEIFGTSEAWDRMREGVIDRLTELER